jgi:hypothetical protein
MTVTLDLERGSRYALALAQAAVMVGLSAYLVLRGIAIPDLVFVALILACLILARMGRMPLRLGWVVLVFAIAGLLLSATRSAHFYRNDPSQYVGLQRDAAFFVETLHGNTVLYGGQPTLEGARLLRDPPFVASLALKPVDGAADGVPVLLSDDQMMALSDQRRTDFWLGGYQHVLYTDPHAGKGDDTFYFFLTPPDWNNAVLVVPASLYEGIR